MRIIVMHGTLVVHDYSIKNFFSADFLTFFNSLDNKFIIQMVPVLEWNGVDNPGKTYKSNVKRKNRKKIGLKGN